MSANNDPIEITVDKRGNVIILIDRHNLSAAEVLDMAARAMLAAGYNKSEILQAALAYGGRYATDKSAPETVKQAKEPSPSPAAVEAEPKKEDSPENKTEPAIEEKIVLPPPLPVAPVIAKELISEPAAEAKELPIVPPVDQALESSGTQEIAAAPEPAPAVAEKPEPVPAVIATPPVVALRPDESTTPLPEEPVIAPAMEVPAPAPVVPVMEVKAEPEPVSAASPPPFEVPPLAKAPAIPLRVPPPTPVSVMPKAAAPSDSPAPASSKMDEILAADRKRIQALIASNGATKASDEPAALEPANEPAPAIPAWAVPVIPKAEAGIPAPVFVISPPEPQKPEPEPVEDAVEVLPEWLGQKFDPATSTSMLIPPMPGTVDAENPEFAPVADVALSPPPLPKKPVSVVTPAMMARPITAELPPKPPANIPPPPAGGPLSVSPLSRVTGFVKLNTIAIPHYQPDAPPVESTINTPKPVTPSILTPQPPPATKK